MRTKDTIPCNKKTEKKRIAVIFGGCSPEYQISLISAYSVISHMDKSRYTPVMIGISPTGSWYYFDGVLEKIRSDTWCNHEDCTPIAILPDRDSHSLCL